MRAFGAYILARTGVFAATYLTVAAVVGALTNKNPYANLYVLLAAAVISSIVSYFALAGPRARLTQNVHDRAARLAANSRVPDDSI